MLLIKNIYVGEQKKYKLDEGKKEEKACNCGLCKGSCGSNSLING